MRNRIFILIAFVAVGVAASVLFLGQHPSERAAERLHAEFKASGFADLYRYSSLRLKSQIKEAEFVSRPQELQTRLGEIQEIKGFPAPLPRLVADAKFDFTSYHIKGSQGELLESLIWDWQTGEPRLLSYTATVNPDKCGSLTHTKLKDDFYSPVRVIYCQQ